jgi:hypothetical protein
MNNNVVYKENLGMSERLKERDCKISGIERNDEELKRIREKRN